MLCIDFDMYDRGGKLMYLGSESVLALNNSSFESIYLGNNIKLIIY